MTLVEHIDGRSCGCDAPKKLKSLTSIDDALHSITSRVAPVAETEIVPLSRAAGRVLADPVRAAMMTPPFDNAAMDGYAVNTATLTGEGPWSLPVIGRIPAGHAANADVSGQMAVRIFTDAPVPPGADAVIPQEDVIQNGDTVLISRRPATGLHIRRAGRDMRAGQTVVEPGMRLCSRQIAACAAAGSGCVRVRRPLRVSLLVTGNEVRRAGSGRGDAQIWDVNTPMLSAALAGAAISLGPVIHGPDSREGLQRCLAELSADADLIVTTGGISVGEEDHVKPALAGAGAEIFFSGVAIKPGKPVSCGRLGQAIWLGLPGNPLAAFVTWQVFGAAVTSALLGGRPSVAVRRHVVTARPIRRKPGRCELRPVQIVGRDAQGRDMVTFDDQIQSGHVAGLAKSDGLMVLPPELENLSQGAVVEFHPFFIEEQ